MRNIFWVFLLLSLLLHLFGLGVFHLPKEEKEREKPIDIQIVPKEKKEQPQKPLPPQPKKYIPPTPLDEEKDTKLDQDKPVPPKQEKKAPVRDGQDSKKSPEKMPLPQSAPKAQQRPAPPSALPPKSDADMPKVSPDAPKSLPDTSKKDADRKRIDDIMNPKETIEKFANGGAKVTGEDSVSMQYVKFRYQSYFYKFASRLYRVWVYPPEAGMRGEQGVVQASFIISRDGRISSIRIIRSSGYPDLDNEVMFALKKMSGVPLPDSYELDNLKVDAYFRYIIGGGFQVY
jgi:protein TonB